MTYNVFGGTLNLALSIYLSIYGQALEEECCFPGVLCDNNVLSIDLFVFCFVGIRAYVTSCVPCFLWAPSFKYCTLC